MAPDIINTIKGLAHAQREQVIEWRRWMHRHPELSQEEHGTMEFVAERLLTDVEIATQDLCTSLSLLPQLADGTEIEIIDGQPTRIRIEKA